jgi:aspartyl protease family protein
MAKDLLLFAIGAIALAILAPTFLDGAGAPAGAGTSAAAFPAAGQTSQSDLGDRPQAGYREMMIAADPHGQYATEALVNGLPVSMLIDTGASEVSISASTAARLGIVPGPGPKWRIRTANGESIASPVTLETVSFGGLYMKDVQALILAPEAGDVNLLGASFLRRLVSFEQRNGMMILRQ